MSALLGHRKGAFTGVVADRPGLLRAADTGMLFLDEAFRLPGLADRRENIEPKLEYKLDRFAEHDGDRASFNKVREILEQTRRINR